jgi:hypothetical protein
MVAVEHRGHHIFQGTGGRHAGLPLVAALLKLQEQLVQAVLMFGSRRRADRGQQTLEVGHDRIIQIGNCPQGVQFFGHGQFLGFDFLRKTGDPQVAVLGDAIEQGHNGPGFFVQQAALALRQLGSQLVNLALGTRKFLVGQPGQEGVAARQQADLGQGCPGDFQVLLGGALDLLELFEPVLDVGNPDAQFLDAA